MSSFASLYSSPLFSLLDQLLGPYVANLSRDRLRVGVWSGSVDLSDLLLRDVSAKICCQKLSRPCRLFLLWLPSSFLLR